jgi:enamine deaminase RidA (YjgF/YER057c/UK114 family)
MAVLVLVFCSTIAPVLAQDVDLRANEPFGYSHKDASATPGVLAGDTLYVSGQGGEQPDGNLPGNFPSQVTQAMSHVLTVLKDAGMDFGNVTWMNIYLTKEDDIQAMEEVYWKTIGNQPPARTVLVVAALPRGSRIEINCIAVRSKYPRQVIWPEGWTHGAHTDPPAIRVGEMIYLSAQGGRDPVTGREAGDFSGESKQALDNVSAIMKAAHLSMKNVVWVNPYMSTGGEYDKMGAVYSTYFEFGNTPGRGTIQVLGLPQGEHVAFSCIAGADLSKRKAIRPRNMPPSATASPGVMYADTLYLSAKDGFIPGQGMVTPDLVLQARQSMRNLLDGLEEANMDFSDVVSSTIYLRDIKYSADEEGIYSKFFDKRYPAETVLQQNNEASEEAAEQISFIAVRHTHPPTRKTGSSKPQ